MIVAVAVIVAAVAVSKTASATASTTAKAVMGAITIVTIAVVGGIVIATVAAVAAVVRRAWGMGRAAVGLVAPPSARPTDNHDRRGGGTMRRARDDHRWGEEDHDSSRVIRRLSCGNDQYCDSGIESGSLSLLKCMRW